MSGLIYKDFKNIFVQPKVWIALLVFYVVFTFVSESVSMFAAISVVYCSIMPITAAAWDERCNWDRFALTTPLSRREIVLAKYLFGLLLTAAILAVNILLSLIAMPLSELAENVLIAVAFSGFGLFLLSVLMPMVIKLGTEKARVAMMLVFLIPYVAVMVISRMDIDLGPAPANATFLLMLAGLVLAVLALPLSYLLSLRFYRQKEF